MTALTEMVTSSRGKFYGSGVLVTSQGFSLAVAKREEETQAQNRAGHGRSNSMHVHLPVGTQRKLPSDLSSITDRDGFLDDNLSAFSPPSGWAY